MLFHFKIWLFVFGVISSVGKNEWQNYVSEEGKFSVLTPGDFVYKEKDVATELGNMHCASFMYQDTMGLTKNEIYLISYCDYPEYTFHPDSSDLIDELLEVSVDQEALNLNGLITYNHKSKFQGYPGRIFRINYQKGAVVMKSRIFLVEDRFYTIQVYTLYKHNLNFNVDKFFNSFRLLKP